MKLKNSFIFISFLLTLGSTYAADGWKTDFKAAFVEAREEGKNVLVDFTGSDWCGWCIKLDKEVFSKDAFKKYAEDKLVLVEIDFPRKKQQSKELVEQNKKLADKYGIRGFPTILIFSPEEELLGKTGYKAGGPEAYIKHIEEIVGN